MKALIIDEPWITHILEGRKTWELRKTRCHVRGKIGLIRKGSGCVVGTVVIADCKASIPTLEAFSKSYRYHRVPGALQPEGFAKGWRVPWVLKDVRKFRTPRPYKHPPGAVIWGTLPEDF